MKIRMTIHPIDTALLDKLNINHSSVAEPRQVGGIMKKLCKAGYTKISTHIAYFDDPFDDHIAMHFKKDIS